MFPLFKYDKQSIVGLNSEQRQGVKSLVKKLKNGDYKLVDNPCQCGKPQNAEITVEKDMFGIPNENILCSNCGLIRSKQILDEASLSKYYDLDYKPINYNKNVQTVEDYYNSQKPRGKQFYDLLKSQELLDSIKSVYDMGCGAGGVMHYFSESGKACSGNDYSEEYLKFGNSKGMHLNYGPMKSDTPQENTVDLFILAHVYEHLSNPLKELENIFSRVKIGGYLLMEVPGVFANISSKKGYPSAYHQFAHVVNFYNKEYLEALFSNQSLEITYSDERCTFLVKKLGEVKELSFPKSTNAYNAVLDHLRTSFKEYNSLGNPTYLKRMVKQLIS